MVCGARRWAIRNATATATAWVGCGRYQRWGRSWPIRAIPVGSVEPEAGDGQDWSFDGRRRVRRVHGGDAPGAGIRGGLRGRPAGQGGLDVVGDPGRVHPGESPDRELLGVLMQGRLGPRSAPTRPHDRGPRSEGRSGTGRRWVIVKARRRTSTDGSEAGAENAIYIADINNHRVCKVDRPGTITTIAGWGAWAWLHGTDRHTASGRASSALGRAATAGWRQGWSSWASDSSTAEYVIRSPPRSSSLPKTTTTTT